MIQRLHRLNQGQRRCFAEIPIATTSNQDATTEDLNAFTGFALQEVFLLEDDGAIFCLKPSPHVGADPTHELFHVEQIRPEPSCLPVGSHQARGVPQLRKEWP